MRGTAFLIEWLSPGQSEPDAANCGRVSAMCVRVGRVDFSNCMHDIIQVWPFYAACIFKKARVYYFDLFFSHRGLTVLSDKMQLTLKEKET